MRFILIVLALVYGFIRIFWVDGKQERYFILDYYEAIDFVSSYNYDPVNYVQKNVLPYFNSVLINLKTLNTLKSEGIVDLSDYDSIRVQPKSWMIGIDYKDFGENSSFIYCPYLEKMENLEKIIKALKLRYKRNGNVLIVGANSKYLFNLQVFFVDSIERNKQIFWRVSSFIYDLDYLKVFVREGDVVFFSGPFVAGYPNYLDQVKDFLKSNVLYFAFPEFYDSKNAQFGASFLSKNGGIKVFSTVILRNKSKAEVLGSIDLAVNERNCQAVLYRFFDRLSLSENIEIIKNVSENVFNKDFYQFGKGDKNYFSKPPLESGLFIYVLSFLGLIFLAFLVLISYSYYYDMLVANGYLFNGGVFLALGVLNSLGMIVSRILEMYVLFNLFVILGVSFVLVTLFFRVFESVKDIYQRYFEVTFYALCVGLVVNSVFFNEVYWLGVQKVGFIKILLILPVFLSIFAVVPYNQLVLFFFRRLRIMDVGLVFLFTGMIAFYLLRSGNTGFVFPYEEKIRVMLDKFLIARPRFKEFLIGNPSILLSSHYKFFIPLSFVSLGGIVNSFLHIHTPIFYSFLRTLWGILLGLVIFLVIRKLMQVILSKRDNISKGV